MKAFIFLLICLGSCLPAIAQSTNNVALPDFTYKYQKPGKYTWDKVCGIKGRILFGVTIIHDDSIVYVFGGFDTLRLQREMNVFAGGSLVRDPTIRYPGKGFMYNIGFIKDSFLFIGGGMDSNMSRYSERDFWRYNRRSKIWKRLNDLPFYYHHWTAVYEHAGTVVVFVPQLSGAEFEIEKSTFYSYDAATDTWRLSGSAEEEKHAWTPATFKIGEEVFVLLTVHPFNKEPLSSFRKFNLRTKEWTSLENIPGSARDLEFSFCDGRYGFVGGGATKAAVYTRNVYRYDPLKDQWVEIHKFPRYIRRATGWNFGGESYVGFGINDEPGTVGIWKLKAR